jgi:hypothetical protein
MDRRANHKLAMNRCGAWRSIARTVWLGSNQNQEKPMVNYKTLAAASLMSMALTSAAFAQCTECAIYPERDPLNKGAQTPAAKMGLVQPGGAAAPQDAINKYMSTANNPNNARAEMRANTSQRSHRQTSVKKVSRNPEKNSDNMSR